MPRWIKQSLIYLYQHPVFVTTVVIIECLMFAMAYQSRDLLILMEAIAPLSFLLSILLYLMMLVVIQAHHKQWSVSSSIQYLFTAITRNRWPSMALFVTSVLLVMATLFSVFDIAKVLLDMNEEPKNLLSVLREAVPSPVYGLLIFNVTELALLAPVWLFYCKDHDTKSADSLVEMALRKNPELAVPGFMLAGLGFIGIMSPPILSSLITLFCIKVTHCAYAEIFQDDGVGRKQEVSLGKLATASAGC